MALPTTVQELRFDLDVRVRYHDHRRAFFDMAHRVIAWINIMMGTGWIVIILIYVDKVKDLPAMVATAGLVLAGINAWDLVIGSAESARTHEWLFRQFAKLYQDVVRTGDGPGSLPLWNAELLRLISDEPPTYKAVYAQCMNEALDVWGGDPSERRTVSWWQSRLGPFFRMSEQQFPPAH